ncbi:MAG: hypothetical protein ACOYME_12660 [Prochlorotrichaceae cyanobacterium]
MKTLIHCTLPQQQTMDDLRFFDHIIKAETLEAKGIPCTSMEQILIDQIHLNRGQSFSLQFRKAAIALAETYREDGMSCLVVESPFHVTLWYEKRG